MKISVLLEALTGKFETDMQRAAKGFGSSMRSQESAAKRMHRTVRNVFATVGVAAFIRSVLTATIEEERAVAQLNASLESSGRASEATSRALQDHAAALQQVTTYADDTIIAAQSQLLTFDRLGNEVFPRATEAALDLATKMNGDLKGAVVLVGKALNDPVKGLTALTKAGIQFTAAQKDQIKELVENGKRLEAQKIILDQLESKFGGAARAARDTFGGALSGLKNTIGDLLEAKGGGLAGATQAVNDLNKAMNEPGFKSGADNITTAIFRITQFGAEGVSELGNLGQQFGFTFASMAGNVTWIDKLEQDLRDVERALSGSFMSRPLRFLTTSREELQQLKKELEAALKFANFDLFGLTAPADGADGPSAIPGLDKQESFEPIVVETKRRTKELNALITASAKASDAAAKGLEGTLHSLASALGGPAVQAAITLSETLAALDQQERTLLQTGTLTIEQQQQIASARGLATQLYQQQVKSAELSEVTVTARRKEISAAQELINELATELSLMGLTDKDREIAIAQRYAQVSAMSAEGLAIEALIRKIQEEREATANLDFIKAAGQDAFASFIDGSKSAGDALDDFFNRLRQRAAQILAEKLFETLLGGFGTSGDAGSGGGFGAFLGGLFGGARAKGGPVYAGVPYLVGEKGPELVVPRSAGMVVASDDLGGRGGNITNVFNIPPTGHRYSEVQLARETQIRQSRAMSRNR